MQAGTPLPKPAAAFAGLLAALVAAGPLHAQESPAEGTDAAAAAETEEAEPLEQYRVELIVFEYGDALTGTTEDWSAPVEAVPDSEAPADEDASAADLAEASQAGRDASGADGTAPGAAGDNTADETGAVGEPEETVFRFMPVPEEERQLGELYRRLANADGYEPLLHVAWQQPGYGPDVSQPLDLARLAELPERLRGEARLYRSRFLHLVLDLELWSAPGGDRLAPQARPRPLYGVAEEEPLQALEPDVYRLSERRKLRSGELHYYDHSRYGVLAKVTPVEAEEEPDEAGQDGGGEAVAPAGAAAG
jgi:hypothetical protein